MNKQSEQLDTHQLKIFLSRVIEYLEVNNTGKIRKGQAMYNVLSDEYPNLAIKVIKNEVDPFYVDSRIPMFLRCIATEEAINQLGATIETLH